MAVRKLRLAGGHETAEAGLRVARIELPRGGRAVDQHDRVVDDARVVRQQFHGADMAHLVARKRDDEVPVDIGAFGR